MATLSKFIGALNNGGARPNQFEVHIAGPGLAAVSLGTDFRFLCRATTVPSFTIGEVPVPYRGRQVFVSGDRTYDTWTVTVLADQNLDFLKAFVAWSDAVSDVGDSVDSATSGYYGLGTVWQMDRSGKGKNFWMLHDIWPTAVSGIDFAWDTNDTIAEYTVDFRFNYMTFDLIGAGAKDAESVSGD